MTQTDFADKYTSDKNERLLLHRLSDLLQQSEKNCTAVYSSFLDPAQAELAAGVAEFRGMIDFVGGYEGAERNLARFRAHEYCQETEPPIVLITAKAADKNAVISHRDVLGALMGLGIKREMTGDILPNKNIPQFFATNRYHSTFFSPLTRSDVTASHFQYQTVQNCMNPCMKKKR